MCPVTCMVENGASPSEDLKSSVASAAQSHCSQSPGSVSSVAGENVSSRRSSRVLLFDDNEDASADSQAVELTMCRTRTMQERIIRLETAEFANIWKLNSPIATLVMKSGDKPLAELEELGNWRHRIARVHQSQMDVVISYISEKANGEDQRLCSISKEGQGSVEIMELPVVHFGELSSAEMTEQKERMRMYDVAIMTFLEDAGLADLVIDEDDQLPTCLYPFLIPSKEPEDPGRCIVLGAISEKSRHAWVECIHELLVSPAPAGFSDAADMVGLDIKFKKLLNFATQSFCCHARSR